MTQKKRSDWTRDSDGNFVDWTKPPHKIGGVVDLRLHPDEILSESERLKRQYEYLRLTARARIRTKNNAPSS